MKRQNDVRHENNMQNDYFHALRHRSKGQQQSCVSSYICIAEMHPIFDAVKGSEIQALPRCILSFLLLCVAQATLSITCSSALRKRQMWGNEVKVSTIFKYKQNRYSLLLIFLSVVYLKKRILPVWG